MLAKEEGVGVNCSELRKAGQGSWCRLLQDPRQWSGHLGNACPSAQHFPDPHQFPLAPKAVRALGTAGGLCRPVGGGGREEGDKHGWSHRLVPLSLLPSRLPSLLRIPEMLEVLPGPRSLPTLSLPTSCFQLSRRLRPSLFPVLVARGSEGPRWPLQGAAGKAGDAAAAGDGGTHDAPVLAG